MQLFLHPLFLLLILLSVSLHWILPPRRSAREVVLLTASLILLTALHPPFALFALVGATIVHRVSGPGRGRTLLLIALLAVGALCLGRMAPVLAHRFAGGTWLESHALVPLGLSYFLFRLFQYSADRFRGTIPQGSWGNLMLFLFFFPTLPAGPMDSYQAFHERRNRNWDSAQFAQGVRRILAGYFKKLFLVGWLFDYLLKDFTSGFLIHTSLEIARSHPAAPLAYVAVMFLYAYLDLSAYTDIAVGLGALFGFRLSENFDRPFSRANLADFWRSWHMSVSQWCRNQIYFPVFGMSRKPWLATYASMATLGLWHQLSWNWLAWAGYHATGLVAYSHWKRWRKPPQPRRLGRLAGVAGTLIFVALGYAFVATTDLSAAWNLLAACVSPWERSRAG